MGDNPNWKPFLDKIPEVLHEQIKPVLAEWDQGVNAKLEEVRGKYEPYKAFIDNGVDPNAIDQALQVADLIREDPKLVVQRLNEAQQLGFIDAEEAAKLQAAQTGNEFQDDLEFDGMDITKHPQFQALTEQLGKIESTLTEQQKAQLEAQQAEEFNAYLKSLHDEHGDFDDDYVMSKMAYADMDGPAAIESYRKLLAGSVSPPNGEQQDLQNQQGQDQASSNGTGNPPPVVLDGNPAGSGSEQQVVDFGNMKKGDTINLVADMLAKAAAENNQ